jgi:hypothetical protein
MKPADYKCKACNIVFEITVADDEQFFEFVSCEKCGSYAKRHFTPQPQICHQGKCGNYKNGYTSNPVRIKKT